MRRNYFIVSVVFLVFFVLSFLTNILGPIIPDIIDSFHVSLGAAAFLPFSFFLAYGVLSVPAGFLVDVIFQEGYVYTLATLAVLSIFYGLIFTVSRAGELSGTAMVALILIAAFVFADSELDTGADRPILLL